MRKIALWVCLGFFVSIVNAGTMPIDLGAANTPAIESVAHDHCHVSAVSDQHEEGASQSTSVVSANHYCCSALAVLTSTSVFSHMEQANLYVTKERVVSISSFAESIYKPPRNYL